MNRDELNALKQRVAYHNGWNSEPTVILTEKELGDLLVLANLGMDCCDAGMHLEVIAKVKELETKYPEEDHPCHGMSREEQLAREHGANTSYDDKDD